MPGNGTVLGLGGPLADEDLAGDVALGLLPVVGAVNPQLPTGAQACDQFALEPAAVVDAEGW